MKRNILVIFMVISLLEWPYIMSGFSRASAQNRIKIAVSIPTLGSIVKDITGNYADIIDILPPGAEPHSYQLPPNTINEFSDVDLFVFTGHFRFEKTVIDAYPNKEILTLNRKSMKYGNYPIKLFTLPGMNGYNPHGYWIYPDNALSIAKAVVDELMKMDPSNGKIYRDHLENFERNINQLKRMYSYLDERYRLRNKPVVIGFPAEEYFVKPLNMDIVAVVVRGEGLTISGEELLTAKEKLLESRTPIIIASDVAMMMSVSSIFTELCSDTGAKIAYVDIVSSDMDSYIGMMYYNLGIVSSTLNSLVYRRNGHGYGYNINMSLIILSITLLVIMIIEAIYIIRLREVSE